LVAQSEPTQKFAELDGNWAKFVDLIQPYHWDTLAALLGGEDVDNRLNVIALPHHKTGSLLIDEINEFAQENIGDVLIDTLENPPSVVVDKRDNLIDLMNWAANRQLIEV